MPKLHLYKNEKETCSAFAEWFAEQVKITLDRQERFSVAFSGGDTPKFFYKILAAEYSEKIDWSKIYVFWGDEKFVSSLNNTTNAELAAKTLFDHVNLPKDHIHVIRTDIAPEESARQYEKLLREHFNNQSNTFDLAILRNSATFLSHS